MKKPNSLFSITRAKFFASISAGFLSFAAIASGQTIIFEENFDDLSRWSSPNNNANPPESADRIIEVTDKDSEIYFGEPGNSYLRLYKNHGESASNSIVAANVFSEPSSVITVSYDFWDNPAIGAQNGIAMYAGPAQMSGSMRFYDIYSRNGILAGISNAYEPGRTHRVQFVMNNSSSDVTYLDGKHTVVSDSFDIWMNGVKIGSNMRNFSRGAGLPIDAELSSLLFAIFTISREEILVDNLVVYKGAHIEFAVEPQPLRTPLVEFDFENESAVNTGSAGGLGELVNGANFGSGLAGGSALDLRAAGAMGLLATAEPQPGMHHQPNAALSNLLSFTITGWFWTDDVFDNGAYLFSKPNAIHLEGADGQLRLDLRELDNSGRVIASATPWHLERGRWVFFAATADFTELSGGVENVRLYYAYEDSGGVTLDATASLPPGVIRSVSHNSVVGNEHQNFGSDRPFNGLIDNLRIWGSTADAMGALDAEQIEAIWRADLGKGVGGAPRIVDLRWENGGFSLSFETEVGQSYLVEYESDLLAGDWNGLAIVEGTGEIVTVSDEEAAALNRRFYRVRLVE